MRYSTDGICFTLLESHHHDYMMITVLYTNLHMCDHRHLSGIGRFFRANCSLDNCDILIDCYLRHRNYGKCCWRRLPMMEHYWSSRHIIQRWSLLHNVGMMAFLSRCRKCVGHLRFVDNISSNYVSLVAAIMSSVAPWSCVLLITLRGSNDPH